MVVILADFPQRLPEPELGTVLAGQLHLHGGQVGGGGDDIDTLGDTPADRFRHRRLAADQAIEVVLPVVLVDPEAGAGVALGVGVDQKDPFLEFGQSRRQIHRR